MSQLLRDAQQLHEAGTGRKLQFKVMGNPEVES